MADTVFELLSAGNDEAPAIVVPGGPTLSFAEMRRQVEHLAGQLNAAGVGRGERVALVTPNGPEAALTFLAATACATAAPLNPAYREDEFRFYMDDLNAKVLITLPGDAEAAHAAAGPDVIRLALAGEPGSFTLQRDGADVPSQAPVFAQPDDVALVLHTSGTTARPKIVPLSQRNLVVSAGNIREALALTPADRCLNVMPLFHIHGLMAAMLASLSAGASVITSPGFDAFKFFNWIDECKPSWYTAVPTMHQLVLTRAGRQKDVIERNPLRFMRSSSASMPPTVMAELEATFNAPLIEAYGMTEASHQMATNPLPPLARKPGAVGLGRRRQGVDHGRRRLVCSTRAKRVRLSSRAAMSPAATRTTRPPTSRRSPTAGSAPATRATRTQTVISTSRAASRKSSTAVARRCRRAKSTRSCWSTRQSPRPSPSQSPTTA